MRLLLVVVAGCGFTQDRTPIVDEPAAALCDAADPTLRLCLDFEATARDVIPDLSANALSALGNQVGTVDREAELAAVLSPMSRLRIAESAALDITGALAIDLWIRPMGAMPGRHGLVDNDKQYAIHLEDRRLRCSVKDRIVEAEVALDDGGWHHVGCTYDGATMKLFLDGDLAQCRAEGTPIPTAGDSGLAIGATLAGREPMFTEPFTGGLDNVRVWARADIDLCQAAGKTGCLASCP